MKKTLTLLALGALVLVPAASAHVTVNPNEVPADSFSRFADPRPDRTARRGHDQDRRCSCRRTLAFVGFQPKPGWTRTRHDGEARRSRSPNDEGETVTERIGTVTWEGGKIGPGEFDEFGMSAKVPGTSRQTLVFPATQTYSNGEVVHWIGAPDCRHARAARHADRRRSQETAAPTPTTTDRRRGRRERRRRSDGRDTFAFVIADRRLVAGSPRSRSRS